MCVSIENMNDTKNSISIYRVHLAKFSWVIATDYKVSQVLNIPRYG